MRQFDHNGLLLAEYQGKLFESSNELNCSTGVYIRRFLHSDLMKKLDAKNPAFLSLDIRDKNAGLLVSNFFNKSECKNLLI